MILGVDPGKTNFAAVFINDTGKFLGGHVFDYSKLTDVEAIYSIPYDLDQLRYDCWCKSDETDDLDQSIDCMGMERYVAYGNTLTSSSEGILMLSGATISYGHKCNGHSMPIHTFRAIDWKPAVCKILVKTKGFDNPSTKFDKKFSIAAAECITGKKFKNDHLADAVCIGFYAAQTQRAKIPNTTTKT